MGLGGIGGPTNGTKPPVATDGFEDKAAKNLEFVETAHRSWTHRFDGSVVNDLLLLE